MASQFLCSLKYGLLAMVAFVGPKVITESGNYLSNVEKGFEASSVKKNEQNINNRLDLQRKDYSASYPNGEFQKKDKINLVNDSAGNDRGDFLAYDKKYRNHNDFYEKSTNDFGSGGGVENGAYENTSVNHNLWNAEAGWRIPITPQEVVFRFDKTPAWISQTWKRVDVVHSEYPLIGYRVAIITGQKNDDLGGVLTYYFEKNRLGRIDFSGQTGDFQKIQQFLIRVYGMKQSEESLLNTSIYESSLSNSYFREEMPTSFLKVTTSQTLYPGRSKGNYEIEIKLYPPD